MTCCFGKCANFNFLTLLFFHNNDDIFLSEIYFLYECLISPNSLFNFENVHIQTPFIVNILKYFILVEGH